MINFGFACGARSDGLGFGNSFDGCKDLFANFGFIAADRNPQFRRIGDDVVFGPSLNLTHRDHGDFSGLHFAGDDGLQCNDGAGGDYDGFDGGVGHGAVSAFAIDRDTKGVRV